MIEAIAEHNILSIKKLYKSIRIESLGHLLKMKPEIAKIIAERMISEGRIKGAIDHTYGFIRFKCKFHFYVISCSIIFLNDFFFVHSPKPKRIVTIF